MTERTPIWGVVLASGQGRRFGFPKALLRWQGQSVLEHQLQAQQAAGVVQAAVVVSLEVRRELEKMLPAGLLGQIRWVEGDPTQDPFDSLRRALSVLPRGIAALTGPIDQGPYPAALLHALLVGFEPVSARVRIPTYQGKWGHPVLLGAGFWARLPSAAPEGLRGVLEESASSLEFVAVTQSAALRNINTGEDYQRFLEEASRETD
jgi:CTP:molybdopterin cytidylyltransferase MocA